MRILWLNANLLAPLDKGGKLRTWYLMRQLAAHHEITYLSFADPHERPEHLDAMHDVCARLEVVPRRDAPKWSLRFFAGAAVRLLDPRPYAVAKYRSRAYAAKVRALLAAHPFDLVVCDFLVPAVNMPRRMPCPTVLFTHNVEAEIWRRHAETRTGFAAWLFRMQWKRMLRFERQAVRRFDLVLAVSEADSETLERLYGAPPHAPAAVIPTGVDTSYFTPSTTIERPNHLVFTGSMNWLPNEDGILFFCREILPRIRAILPGVTLEIIGRDPGPAIRALAMDRGIEVTGRVADVRPHVASGAVYIVPLRIGGGTRLKIFEAMAMGKAIVSTTIGAEGLPLTPGRDLLVGDDPQTFADAVVRLLRDDNARWVMGERARALVVERYDWRAAARVLEETLLHCCSVRLQPDVGGALPELVRLKADPT
jgi:sugar transferase (PEP-CTERM/EpsH1 system associated)